MARPNMWKEREVVNDYPVFGYRWEGNSFNPLRPMGFVEWLSLPLKMLLTGAVFYGIIWVLSLTGLIQIVP